MYRRILVPLDGSRRAEEALPYVARLAALSNSRVFLFHAMAEGLPRAAERAAINYLDEAAGRWQPHIKHLRTLYSDGIPHKEILDAVRGEAIGLVAMTTHGRSGMRRWTLGSVTEKVLRSCPKPMLLLRSEGLSFAQNLKRVRNLGAWPSRIVVPLDGSKEAERVFDALRPLLTVQDPELVFVRAVPPGEKTAPAHEYLTGMGEMLCDEGLTVYDTEAPKSDDPADAILRVAKEEKADMLAMTTHGRGGFNRLFFGSVAEKVLRHSDRPLLLVRAAGKK